jgi:uncharacterized protein (TIGR02588 family)
VSDTAGRSTAEWTTFAGSCLVLLAVIALIGVQMLEPPSAAAPAVTSSDDPVAIGGQHQVSVEVTNEGDETAADVQVVAELTLGGETTTADQTIDFLAGSEVTDLVFVFADDPMEGELTIEVTGFAVP